MPTLAGVSGHSFQSTLPLRGATSTLGERGRTQCDFNPHSPCGERHVYAFVPEGRIDISIHTPLAGSDLQSLLGLGALLGISIHTPLAGSDTCPRST